MSGRSDIIAGRAHVVTYVKNSALLKGLAQIKQQMVQLGQHAMQMGGVMMRAGAIGVGAFAALGAALLNPLKAAGDLMETTSKFGSVFADQTVEVKAWGDAYADAVGRSKSETMAALATFQSFFQGLSIGGQEAAGFSKEMAGLAVDFASFHNLSDGEAMQRFISALSGSGEVLSMFGVNIMQANLDLKLVELGFKKSTAGATEMQKVLARMDIIKETMGRQGAVGDALRTAGSFSNQLKALQGELKNTAETFGNELLPVVTPFLTKTREIVEAVGAWMRENTGLAISIAKVALIGAAASAAVAAVGAAIFGIGAAVAPIISVVLGAKAIIVGAIAAILSPIGLVVAALAGAGVYWVRYTESGKAALRSVMAVIEPYARVVTDAIRGISTAFRNGEIGLAGQIAMKALETVFLMGKLAIVNIWFSIRDSMLGIWDSVVVETAAAIAYVSSLWNSLTTVVRATVAVLAITWNTFTEALMDTSLGQALAGMWDGFRDAGVAAFKTIMAWANGLIGAFNAIKGQILSTIEAISVAAPAAIDLTAARANQGLKEKTGIDVAAMNRQIAEDAAAGKQLVVDAFANADNAAVDARENVGNQRDNLRAKRNGGADAWRDEQQTAIDKARSDLVALNVKAAMSHKPGAKDVAGGAPDEPKPGAAGLPTKNDLQNFGTFSGAALAMAGNDGGAQARIAKAAEEQKDLLAKQLKEFQDAGKGIWQLVQKFGMV